MTGVGVNVKTAHSGHESMFPLTTQTKDAFSQSPIIWLCSSVIRVLITLLDAFLVYPFAYCLSLPGGM